MSPNEARILGAKLARKGVTKLDALAQVPGLAGASLLAFTASHARVWFDGLAPHMRGRKEVVS